MIRYNNLFEKVFAFENLYYAFKKSLKGSGNTLDSSKFNYNYEKELLKLKSEIQSGIYKPQKYRYFIITDPKERTISVADFRDRVVHHAIINIIEPIFEKSFIFHSYATRKNKGTHRAINTAQKYLKNNYYYFKTDVSKYFDSIDHNILIDLIKRKIKDKRLIDLISIIIKNNDISKGINIKKGLPIGNLTSQFFANIYLNGFDHFIKHKLKVKNYIRYMDDFVIFSNEKHSLKLIREEITDYLNIELKLSLKEKATFINTRQNGLPFLGVRIFPELIRIKKENVKRLKKRIKKRENELLTGKISPKKYTDSVISIVGYLKNYYTYKLMKSLDIR